MGPDGTKRRLDKALTIKDLGTIAKRRPPKATLNYTDSSAEAELSVGGAREAFQDVEFHPAILRDLSEVDFSRDVSGQSVVMPVGIAPTGFTRMMHTEGETAGVQGASQWGIPIALSIIGTRWMEEVQAASPDVRKRFQLWMWKNRDHSMELVDEVWKSGFGTRQVTVDVPVAGARLRDQRNGFSIPPTLTAGTIIHALPRPWW